MKKKLFSALANVIIISITLSLWAFAAPASSASVSKKEAYVGDSVTVTFKVTGDKAIGSVDAYVDFDDTKLTYLSVESSLGGIMANAQGQTVKISDFSATNTSKTYTLTVSFKTKALGDATVTLRGIDGAYTDDDVFSASNASAKISVKSKDTTLSSDCKLKDLQPPEGCKLSPSFSPDVTEYTCTVPYTVKSFPLEPIKSSSKAKVAYFGSVSLNVGENTRGVKVTAEDGTVKTYTVKITRLAENNTTEAPTPDTIATPNPNEGDLTVTVDGKELTVMEKILSELPQGFIKTTYSHKGKEVEVGVLDGMMIYELTDGETSDFYFIFYNGVQPYVSLKVTGTEYTVLGETERDMSGLEKREFTLPSGKTVTGWYVDKLGEGYYAVSVFNNLTEEECIAVYCVEDGTLQKMSEKLLESESNFVCGTVNEPSTVVKKKNYKNLLIGIMCLAVALIIALVIVLVKRKEKKNRHTWDFEQDSDPYGINGEDDGFFVNGINTHDNDDTAYGSEYAPTHEHEHGYEDNYENNYGDNCENTCEDNYENDGYEDEENDFE